MGRIKETKGKKRGPKPKIVKSGGISSSGVVNNGSPRMVNSVMPKGLARGRPPSTMTNSVRGSRLSNPNANSSLNKKPNDGSPETQTSSAEGSKCCCCCSASLCPKSKSDTDVRNVDNSMISQPISLGTKNMRNIMKCLTDGTPEVRNLIMNECDVIFECIICKNLFRSLVNFLDHKRNFCTDHMCQRMILFDPLTVEYKDPNATQEDKANSPVSISLPEATSSSSAVAASSSCMKSTAGPEVKKRPKTLDAFLRKIFEDRMSKSAAGNESHVAGISLSTITTNANAVFQRRVDEDEAIKETSGGAIETRDESPPPAGTALSSTASTPSDESLESVISDDANAARRIKVTPRIPICPSSTPGVRRIKPPAVHSDSGGLASVNSESEDATGPKTCPVCSSTFLLKKTLRVHMKTIHASERLVYPCPFCCLTFKQLCNASRHMLQTHRKGKNDVRRLREVVKMRARIENTAVGVEDENEDSDGDSESVISAEHQMHPEDERPEDEVLEQNQQDDTCEQQITGFSVNFDEMTHAETVLEANDSYHASSRIGVEESSTENRDESGVEDMGHSRNNDDMDVSDERHGESPVPPLIPPICLDFAPENQVPDEPPVLMSVSHGDDRKARIPEDEPDAPLAESSADETKGDHLKENLKDQSQEKSSCKASSSCLTSVETGHVCSGCNKYFPRAASKIGHEKICEALKSLSKQPPRKKSKLAAPNDASVANDELKAGAPCVVTTANMTITTSVASAPTKGSTEEAVVTRNNNHEVLQMSYMNHNLCNNNNDAGDHEKLAKALFAQQQASVLNSSNSILTSSSGNSKIEMDDETRVQLQKISSVKKLKCLKCKWLSFSSEGHLIQHSVTHLGKEVLKCKGCIFQTVSRPDLELHLSCKHSIGANQWSKFMVNLSTPLSSITSSSSSYAPSAFSSSALTSSNGNASISSSSSPVVVKKAHHHSHHHHHHGHHHHHRRRNSGTSPENQRRGSSSSERMSILSQPEEPFGERAADESMLVTAAEGDDRHPLTGGVEPLLKGTEEDSNDAGLNRSLSPTSTSTSGGPLRILLQRQGVNYVSYAVTDVNTDTHNQ